MADILIPKVKPDVVSEMGKWSEAMWLPCELTVELPIPKFTVGDVLRLDVQSLINARWNQNADVPIRINGHLIAWAEFEVVGDRLAVRVTRLA